MTPTDDRKPRWDESDNPTTLVRSGSWRAAIWITCAVLFFGGLSVAHWGFGVWTSDVKGAGDATKRNNSGDNRIAAQERFEKLYTDLKAADQRIDTMAAAKREQPGDVVALTNYTGAVSYCQQAVADYNAEARKVTARDWRSADLPYQIDSTDPATDCKETAK